MARTAVIAGVGPGLGASLANRFAAEGCQLGLFARSEYAEDLAAEIREGTPGDAVGVRADIADRDAVREGFAAVREAFGPVDVLVNHASDAPWAGVDIDPADFERSLQVGPVGSLNCTQAALADMRERGGTVLFTGATSAVRGREGALGFSAAKFALRGMAQSLARELGPEGIRVAHVVIDGQIATPAARQRRDEADLLDPDDLADTYWQLLEGGVSTTTFEVHVTNGRQDIEFL